MKNKSLIDWMWYEQFMFLQIRIYFIEIIVVACLTDVKHQLNTSNFSFIVLLFSNMKTFLGV